MTDLSETKHKRFRLGDWQIDPDTNSMARGNTRRQVEPRAMDVLVVLARQAPAVVSSDALLDACWPYGVQGDNAVHKAITQLRRVFDDPASQPRYIETVRKRGYRLIAELAGDDAAGRDSWLHESPFRGLEPFEEKHAAIFFGRGAPTRQLLHSAGRQLRAGCAMLLVLGPSGSGKTSLIRAGLIPALLAGSHAAGFAVAGQLHLDCADLGNGDLFQALGSVLLDAEADGQLVFDADSAATLGQRLAQAWHEVALRLHGRLQGRRLLLFVDRFEALFRLPHANPALRQAFVATLDRLARSGSVFVVLACRNDFYPDLARHPELAGLKRRGGHFDLAAPSSAEIAQIVRQPARAAGLSFGIDPVSGEHLDDALCDAARSSPDALPLLQYCMQELYRQRSAGGELGFAVFRSLGGIEGAIGERAEQVFARLGRDEAAALPHVLSRLVVVSEGSPAVTALRLPWSALRDPAEKALVRTLIEARLFVSELYCGVAAFGIAHEALLRRWPRVSSWIERHREALRTRSRLRDQTALWRASRCRPDMLLPPGLQAIQAREVVRMPEFRLDADEQAFVQASLRRIRRGERLRMAAAAALVVLALLASMLGAFARSAARAADAHRTEAEGLMTFMLGELVDQLRPLGRLDLLDRVSARALVYLARDTQGGQSTLTQRARALQVLSEVRIARADPTAAARALQLARAILQRQLEDAPDDTAVLKSAGENAFWLGQLYFDRKDWPNAQRHFGEYRDLSDRLAAAAPADPAGWVEQSYAHSSLGTLALQRGEVQRAAQEFALSIALKLRALARAPGATGLLADLADSLSWEADALARQGRLAEASARYAREMAVATQLHDTAPGNAAWTKNLASALSHQAEMQRIAGDERAAAAFLVRARTLLREAVRQDPTNRDWQKNLYITELGLLDLHAHRMGAAQALAMLAAWERGIARLIQLEPEKLNLQLLLAALKKRQASINLQFFSKRSIATDIMNEVVRLGQLSARAPDDQAIRDVLADVLLFHAGAAIALHDPAAGQASCRQAGALLAASVAGSTDYHVLAPWVRAQLCLGRGRDAGVVAAMRLLDKMKYRERAYLHDISIYNLGSPTNGSN